MRLRHLARYAKPTHKSLKKWWPRAELNHRHKDFQSSALPTELLGRPGRAAERRAFGRRELYPAALRHGLAARRLLQGVAEAAHSHDAHAAGLQLLAQAMHVHLDRVGGDLFAPFAKVRHELFLGDEPAGAL